MKNRMWLCNLELCQLSIIPNILGEISLVNHEKVPLRSHATHLESNSLQLLDKLFSLQIPKLFIQDRDQPSTDIGHILVQDGGESCVMR